MVAVWSFPESLGDRGILHVCVKCVCARMYVCVCVFIYVRMCVDVCMHE